MADPKPKKIVFIKCRAGVVGYSSGEDPRHRCQGTQAELIHTVDHNTIEGYGGRMSTYRCTTCEGVFSIKV